MAAQLYGGVLDVLGRRLAAGEISPGAVLTLAQLEKNHAASRTVIREAIKVLESMRMVESRRRVGIIVRPRAEWDAFAPLLIQWNLAGPFRQKQLEELMELRVSVEPMAAHLAAERASAAERADLLRLAEQLHDLGQRGLGQSDAYLEVDIAFHCVLLAASGNPLLCSLQVPVGEELRGRVRLGMHPTVPAPGTLEEHLIIAQAVAAGESAEAEKHSRAHLMGVWQEITQRQTDRQLP